jgi:hypothetical protein
MQYANKKFKDETVDLDGNQFVGCSFEGCKLMYYGGPIPFFDSCKFGDSSFMFEKGAGNAVEFLRELYHCGLHQNVEAFFEDLRKNPPAAPRAS